MVLHKFIIVRINKGNKDYGKNSRNNIYHIYMSDDKKYAIQSILLEKSYYKTRTKASEWIRKNKFKVTIQPNPNKADNRWFRYRQVQPNKFKKNSFRIKKMSDRMSLVVGVLKNKK